MSTQPEEYEWVVGEQDAGTRLDRFLSHRGDLGTRSRIQRWIEAGAVRVDGRIQKAGTRLRSGQRVTARHIPERITDLPEPEPLDLDVLYEDDAILVVNKPAGLVVHPAAGHPKGTLVNALLHRWRDLPVHPDGHRCGIVHRLDKNTSGALIVAKTGEALERLCAQFQHRQIKKEYLALVWGRPRQRVGCIEAPIARHPVHRKKMAVRPRGRQAVTRYSVLKEFADVSLLRVRPETGRTHQIRVHLASLGHPIVGDIDYARKRAGRAQIIARQALHAARVSLRHPTSGEWVTVRAPLPPDFVRAMELLQESA